MKIMIGEDGKIVMETARCFIHGVDESFTPGIDYRACGECWHVWPTEASFRVDVETLYRELATQGYGGLVPPLDEVYSCPLCTHDF